MLWVCSVLGRVAIRGFGQKKMQKKGHQETVILVLLWRQDKWTLEERPLLANYLEDCELATAFVTLLPECTAAVAPQ